MKQAPPPQEEEDAEMPQAPQVQQGFPSNFMDNFNNTMAAIQLQNTQRWDTFQQRYDADQEQNRKSFSDINTRLDKMDHQLNFLCNTNQFMNENLLYPYQQIELTMRNMQGRGIPVTLENLKINRQREEEMRMERQSIKGLLKRQQHKEQKDKTKERQEEMKMKMMMMMMKMRMKTRLMSLEQRGKRLGTVNPRSALSLDILNQSSPMHRRGSWRLCVLQPDPTTPRQPLIKSRHGQQLCLSTPRRRNPRICVDRHSSAPEQAEPMPRCDPGSLGIAQTSSFTSKVHA
ncbi:hypothetical protein PIB30_091740 [Stylosanthes scabra]|uniref:Uncharacterized protein n=1 Tax=Stylosanthes scabra TaxID=79078 RepID=A0ABU6RVI7_9FABA|nr:hypothetical protein [Stylosanthes scabra]